MRLRRIDNGKESQEGEEGTKESCEEGWTARQARQAERRRLALSELLESTKSALEKARSMSPKVLVAYSDGKDSRVVMDLAKRWFDHVEGFYMEWVPAIAYMDADLAAVEKRWSVKIHRFPHYGGIAAMKEGQYCNPWWQRDDVPDIKLADIYSYAMIETKIPLILTGAKKADSGWRKRFMHATQHWGRIVYPLAEWAKWDVLSYLKGRGIAIPDNSAGGTASGVGLVPHELMWIYDNHPADFWRIAEYFPYIEALIWRRKFYGTDAERSAVVAGKPRTERGLTEEEAGQQKKRGSRRRAVKFADVQDRANEQAAADGGAVQSSDLERSGQAKATDRFEEARPSSAADVE